VNSRIHKDNQKFPKKEIYFQNYILTLEISSLIDTHAKNTKSTYRQLKWVWLAGHETRLIGLTGHDAVMLVIEPVGPMAFPVMVPLNCAPGSTAITPSWRKSSTMSKESPAGKVALTRPVKVNLKLSPGARAKNVAGVVVVLLPSDVPVTPKVLSGPLIFAPTESWLVLVIVPVTVAMSLKTVSSAVTVVAASWIVAVAPVM